MEHRTKFPGRKKRYALAASVATFAIVIALYYAAESNPYKTTRSWQFDSDQENGVPDGFVTMQTAGGGSWLVRPDDFAVSKPNVIARLPANSTESNYSMLVLTESSQSNFRVSVKFKIVSGEEQVAGLIFRLQDESHYFVLFADALNDRFSLCRADDNKLICIQDANVNVESGKWYTITAHVAAQGIAGYLDDKLLIQRYDQHYTSGTIGLWARLDSKVYFDDLSLVY